MDPGRRDFWAADFSVNGTLQNVADLNLNFSAANSFDIGGASGRAFTLLNSEDGTKIYQINLQNGELKAGKSLDLPMVRGFAVGLGF